MKGIILFVDVLGYQNLLSNNSVAEAALQVIDIILNAPKKAAFLSEVMEKISRPEIQEFNKRIKHLVFSDTIVLTLDYPENAEYKWIKFARNIMSIYAAYIAAEMFENGLPIRGVMHEGDFVIKETCLAGTGMSEVYQVCEQLNFSGVVCSPSLSSILMNNESIDNDSWPSFTYLTPMKDGREEKLVVVDWMLFIGKDLLEKCQNDTEGAVLKSFWSHKKDCSNSVDAKVKNTVKFIRKMLHNLELNAVIVSEKNTTTSFNEEDFVVAVSFFQGMFEYFGIQGFTMTSLEDFDEILGERVWYEFLAATNDFRIGMNEESAIRNDRQVLLLCPISRRGMVIMPEDRPDFVKMLAKFERKFLSFAKLPSIKQKELLNKFVVNDNWGRTTV